MNDKPLYRLKKAEKHTLKVWQLGDVYLIVWNRMLLDEEKWYSLFVKMCHYDSKYIQTFIVVAKKFAVHRYPALLSENGLP